jgi:hypothetical protein
VALIPAGGTKALADLRGGGAVILVVDCDTVRGIDAREQDGGEVYQAQIHWQVQGEK